MKLGSKLLVCPSCESALLFQPSKKANPPEEPTVCKDCATPLSVYHAVYSGRRLRWVNLAPAGKLPTVISDLPPQEGVNVSAAPITGHSGHVGVRLMLVIAAVTFLIGCSHLLGTKVRPESPIAGKFGISTNDAMIVAYLKEAQGLNRMLNPTPSHGPINTMLEAVMIIAAAAAGWYGRHRSGIASARNAANIIEATHGKTHAQK